MTTLQTSTFIFTVSILFACGGQEHTNKIVEQKPISINLDILPVLKKIVDGIEKGNIVESSFIGEDGSPSEQWDKYELCKMRQHNLSNSPSQCWENCFYGTDCCY